MNNRSLMWIVLVILALAIIAGLIYFATRDQEPVQNQQQMRQMEQQNPQDNVQRDQFNPQTFQSAHAPNFDSAEPANNEVVSRAPQNVEINFSQSVTLPNSKISVQNVETGESVTNGKVTISSDSRSLRVPVEINSSGNYKVDYSVCFSGNECFNGSYGFSVDLS